MDIKKIFVSCAKLVDKQNSCYGGLNDCIRTMINPYIVKFPLQLNINTRQNIPKAITLKNSLLM